MPEVSVPRGREAFALLAYPIKALLTACAGVDTIARRDASEITMADNTEVLSNQKTILENQKTILANQQVIKDNQGKIQDNQRMLEQILENQKKILALLSK
ncbi:MAG TPA: hypothetical protein VK604_28765 [Bryobacteraceae bacterium]|nr:hypothetical protein [Bryobacteraceae bacterium]